MSKITRIIIQTGTTDIGGALTVTDDMADRYQSALRDALSETFPDADVEIQLDRKAECG